MLIHDSIVLLDLRDDKFLPTRQIEAPDCSAGLRSIALSSTGILAAAAENGMIYCWVLQPSSKGDIKTTTTVTQQSAVELPFGISAKRIQWARRRAKASQLLAAVCDDGGLLACRYVGTDLRLQSVCIVILSCIFLMQATHNNCVRFLVLNPLNMMLGYVLTSDLRLLRGGVKEWL